LVDPLLCEAASCDLNWLRVNAAGALRGFFVHSFHSVTAAAAAAQRRQQRQPGNAIKI